MAVASKPPPTLRCAIYTRKSSEEGLEQNFNSLHAQREACEAYVLSQTGEGWRALSTIYDDGGFSGGNMDRPGLKRLLDDIDQGMIDVVVVYKVDRLTRALTDFAKIVDRFDAKGVSFVSVTQAFNTTSSMGRLTLNVLLSFAQFEREVTGERIRDKIAASKAKGMWMGGNLPLGYDTKDRELVINPAEADQVRAIFQRYLKLGSVHRLAEELKRDGIRSKPRLSAKGVVSGGCEITRGPLFHLLQNRIYVGQIVHKGTCHPGLHEPIVDLEVFEAVQSRLNGNRRLRTEKATQAASSSLTGLLFDADGCPMSPTHARGSKGGIYRYYVSSALQRGKGRSHPDVITRVPTSDIDELVRDRVGRLLGERSADLRAIVRRVEIGRTRVEMMLEAMPGSAGQSAPLLDDLRNTLPPGDILQQSDGGGFRLTIPVRLKLRGGRSSFADINGAPALTKARLDRSLLKAIRTAHALVAEHGLGSGATESGSAPENPYQRKLLPLAFLAPDIQQAVFDGRQPASMTLQSLLEVDLPISWIEQRQALGFKRAA